MIRSGQKLKSAYGYSKSTLNHDSSHVSRLYRLEIWLLQIIGNAAPLVVPSAWISTAAKQSLFSSALILPQHEEQKTTSFRLKVGSNTISKHFSVASRTPRLPNPADFGLFNLHVFKSHCSPSTRTPISLNSERPTLDPSTTILVTREFSVSEEATEAMPAVRPPLLHHAIPSFSPELRPIYERRARSASAGCHQEKQRSKPANRLGQFESMLDARLKTSRSASQASMRPHRKSVSEDFRVPKTGWR